MDETEPILPHWDRFIPFEWPLAYLDIAIWQNWTDFTRWLLVLCQWQRCLMILIHSWLWNYIQLRILTGIRGWTLEKTSREELDHWISSPDCRKVFLPSRDWVGGYFLPWRNTFRYFSFSSKIFGDASCSRNRKSSEGKQWQCCRWKTATTFVTSNTRSM